MDLFEALSGFAVRHLPRKHLLALRETYHGLRVKLHPLLKIVYGTFDAEDLRRHLEEKIDPNFEILMVHSSINHMSPMYTGNPLEMMLMLKDFCGPDRTLVMPAFYFGDANIDDVVESYRQNPIFDMRRTPSQMGMVTELFRRTKGACHSMHPTHRVTALGPLADTITKGHFNAGSTFGKNTPFDVMAQHNTRIIGIGKPFEVLTQVHHAEDLLGDAFPVPGKVTDVAVTVRDRSKQTHSMTLHWRKFDWPRNMWKLREYMSPDQLEEWDFHHVPVFSTQANLVTDALLKAGKNNKTLYENK